MEKASRWMVAAFGIFHLVAMVLAAVFLPASDVSESSAELVTGTAFLRGGGCLVLAAVCLLVVSGSLSSLIIEYHRDSSVRSRPMEASAIASLGTGVASILTVAGVFYATRAYELGRVTYALGSLVAMTFAFLVAFALLRAGRALVVGYVAIGVGLAQAIVVVSLLAAASARAGSATGLVGSLSTAAFAILIAMLGFLVAAGAD